MFSEELGKLKGFSHRIKVKEGSTPVKQKRRGLPISARVELRKMLDDMVESGTMEEVESSEWVSPIVLAQKPDKSFRLCVDMSVECEFGYRLPPSSQHQRDGVHVGWCQHFLHP